MTSDLQFKGGGTTAILILKPSARARVMRLRIDPRTGAVTLTVPRRASRRKALEWAASKRAWIESVLETVPPALALAPGGTIPLYGRPHLIDWRADRSRIVRVEADRLLVGGPREGLEQRLLRWLRRHALSLLERESAEFAAKAGVTVSGVGVGDPLSRWGSCSSTGMIRYSWRLILAPDWVRRATVAHEVAHRVHMNHGPAFHALVEQLLGHDPSPARQWLRANGSDLHRIGRLV